MENVMVRKKELLERVQNNRELHRRAFLCALDGYKRECVEQLEAHLALIKDGKKVTVHIHLPVPADHTPDYDRVIGMLNMSIDDDIELPEEDFNRYVMDNWEWKDQWTTSNTLYMEKGGK